jgi:ADP-ribose pyrophosphatase
MTDRLSEDQMERVYEGKVFSVEVGQRRFPNGIEHGVAIVRHRPSVVVIPVLDDGRVLLVRQYRPSVDRELWELPAGSLNPEEAAEFAAVRECAEETGFVPTTIERLAGLYPAPGFCDEELIFFRVSGLEPVKPGSPYQPDEDEDILAQPFSIEDARGMVTAGEIVDLKTAYGLTLA